MAEIILLITFALLLLLGAWSAQSLLERERLASVSDLSGDKLAKVAVLEQASQLEAAAELVEAGLDLRPPEDMVDPAERWRLIDRDELLRLVDEAAALPRDLQRDLADLIEVSDPVRLARIISEMRRASGDAALEERLSVIRQRIGAAAELRALARSGRRHRSDGPGGGLAGQARHRREADLALLQHQHRPGPSAGHQVSASRPSGHSRRCRYRPAPPSLNTQRSVARSHHCAEQ